jgi:hypothetical protein
MLPPCILDAISPTDVVGRPNCLGTLPTASTLVGGDDFYIDRPDNYLIRSHHPK